MGHSTIVSITFVILAVCYMVSFLTLFSPKWMKVEVHFIPENLTYKGTLSFWVACPENNEYIAFCLDTAKDVKLKSRAMFCRAFSTMALIFTFSTMLAAIFGSFVDNDVFEGKTYVFAIGMLSAACYGLLTVLIWAKTMSDCASPQWHGWHGDLYKITVSTGWAYVFFIVCNIVLFLMGLGLAALSFLYKPPLVAVAKLPYGGVQGEVISNYGKHNFLTSVFSSSKPTLPAH